MASTSWPTSQQAGYIPDAHSQVTAYPMQPTSYGTSPESFNGFAPQHNIMSQPTTMGPPQSLQQGFQRLPWNPFQHPPALQEPLPQTSFQWPRDQNVQQNFQRPLDQSMPQGVQQPPPQSLQQNFQHPTPQSLQQNFQQPPPQSLQQNFQQPPPQSLQQNFQQPPPQSLQQNFQHPPPQIMQQNFQNPPPQSLQQNFQNPPPQNLPPGFQHYPPQNQNLQPGYQQAPNQASQQAQPPALTFEQQRDAFRPTPEPHPNPVPRPGQGRKKKDRPFWAPASADARLKQKHEDLYKAHTRVVGAEQKLAANTDPAKTAHFQNMVLRNMQKREGLRIQCERIELGLNAVEITVEEAKQQTEELFSKYIDRLCSVSSTDLDLSTKYSGCVAPDGVLHRSGMDKKDGDSLTSTRNWLTNARTALIDSFSNLYCAMEAENPHQENGMALLMFFHHIGCYEEGSIWLFPQNPQLRAQYSITGAGNWSDGHKYQIEQSAQQAMLTAQPGHFSVQPHQALLLDEGPDELEGQANPDAQKGIEQPWNSGCSPEDTKNQQTELVQPQDGGDDAAMADTMNVPHQIKDQEIGAESEDFDFPDIKLDEFAEQIRDGENILQQLLHSTEAGPSGDHEQQGATSGQAAPPEEQQAMAVPKPGLQQGSQDPFMGSTMDYQDNYSIEQIMAANEQWAIDHPEDVPPEQDLDESLAWMLSDIDQVPTGGDDEQGAAAGQTAPKDDGDVQMDDY
ncbi:hypothetical protein diail_5555 [Diaporthe ilicicola]|nr:hypothetical protein diail_5555 [Diaporthe ilicicola]